LAAVAEGLAELSVKESEIKEYLSLEELIPETYIIN